MTPKERWLASFKMQPVDRLVYWPKLDAAYPTHQKMPFREWSNEKIHHWMGTDPRYGVKPVFKEITHRTQKEVINDGTYRRIIFTTPSGTTEQVSQFDVPSVAWHPIRFPICDRDTLRVMIEFYSDLTVELDRDALETARMVYQDVGDKGMVGSAIGESPLMHFVEWLAGIENAHYFLTDFQDDVEALFDAMHRVLLRESEITVEYNPADLLTMVENTSTTLISPAQYQRYSYHHIMDYARLSRAAGRNMELHMCGHLKRLLPMLADMPVETFEAFTSPTVGNTTLLDGRKACPNICLSGGTNAALWLRPLDEIIAAIQRSLDELPHHRGIILTSGGVQPPACPPEKIKAVADWLKTYPLRMSEEVLAVREIVQPAAGLLTGLL
jgi:hypothetical protein